MTQPGGRPVCYECKKPIPNGPSYFRQVEPIIEGGIAYLIPLCEDHPPAAKPR
jgi:hypothetical protein